jgi:hypothetical protein
MSIVQMGPGIGAPRSLARADLPGPVYTLPPTHPQTSTQRGNFGLNNVMYKFVLKHELDITV